MDVHATAIRNSEYEARKRHIAYAPQYANEGKVKGKMGNWILQRQCRSSYWFTNELPIPTCLSGAGSKGGESGAEGLGFQPQR